MQDKTCYITDLKEKTQVEGLFLVKEKNQGMKKTGSPYIALVLSDKTGGVKARIWDNVEKLGSQFNDGDIVKIKGWAILYQGTLQLNIVDIEKQAGTDVNIFDFLPATTSDPDQTFQELTGFIEKIADAQLKALLNSIFNDPAIADLFKLAPAAKTLHHAYVGGLLEHTLKVTRLALVIASQYQQVNQDLLLAGAMLHDIGKIYELSLRNNFDYTDSGRLIGHITMGVEIINEKIKLIADFPESLALILKHLILSHHGEYVFGSPRRPKTTEALILNYLDDLDSKVAGLEEFIRKEKKPDTKWTSYYKLFDRYIYTDTFVDDEIPDTADTDTE